MDTSSPSESTRIDCDDDSDVAISEDKADGVTIIQNSFIDHVDTKSEQNNNHGGASSSAQAPKSKTKQTNDHKESDKEKKKKAKNEKRALLSNPDKIVESVLQKSTFKVPNLSQIVTEKFCAPDYHSEIQQEIGSLNYEDTVGSYQVCMSILPSRFDNSRFHVNLDPSAITSLTCIYQKPEKKDWRRKRKGNKQRNGDKGKDKQIRRNIELSPQKQRINSNNNNQFDHSNTRKEIKHLQQH